MALGDPFGETLRASRERSQGIERGVGVLGQVGMQAGQGIQTQNLLKQFGILTEKEQPYSMQEIKDIAKQKFGTDINVNSTMPEEKQVETATKLLASIGVKLPKKTTPEVNLDRAAKLGTEYKPGVLGGEVAFKPTLPKMGTQKSGDAGIIADEIIAGRQPPDLSRLYGQASAVRTELGKRGFDLTKAQTEWTATSNYVKNLNSTQQVRLGQAINSVKQSLSPLRQLSDDYERTTLTPLNWAKLQVDVKTGDPTATKIVGQINLMRDEMAQAFMSGGVPTDRAFKLAEDILSPVYGEGQMTAALDQLEFNLNIRENAINSMRPRTIGGELETGRPGSTVKTTEALTSTAGLTPPSTTSKQNAYTQEQKDKYNAYRSSGMSVAEARKKLGI